MSVMASIAGNKPVSTQNLGRSLSLLTRARVAPCCWWGLSHPLGLHKLHSDPKNACQRGAVACPSDRRPQPDSFSPHRGYLLKPALNLQRLFNIDMQTPLLADPSAGCLKCHVCLLSVSPIWCLLSAYGQRRAARPLGGPAFPGCRHPGVGTLCSLCRPAGWEACTELSHVRGKVPAPQGLTKADPVFY